MKPRYIGLLGGTFNPIHEGHLHIARTVTARLHLDFILFIPSGKPPHKENHDIPHARHRMAMLRRALSGIPNFKACDIEIRQAGPSYTIDTVEALKRDYPNDRLIFIMGMDAFTQIKTWKEPERLLTLCDFAILSRPGAPFDGLPKFGPYLNIDRTQLRRLDRGEIKSYRFETSAQRQLLFLSIPPSEISASEIRNCIKTGQATRKRLPQSVLSYIIENKIYNEDHNFEGFKGAPDPKSNRRR